MRGRWPAGRVAVWVSLSGHKERKSHAQASLGGSSSWLLRKNAPNKQAGFNSRPRIESLDILHRRAAALSRALRHSRASRVGARARPRATRHGAGSQARLHTSWRRRSRPQSGQARSRGRGTLCEAAARRAQAAPCCRWVDDTPTMMSFKLCAPMQTTCLFCRLYH